MNKKELTIETLIGESNNLNKLFDSPMRTKDLLKKNVIKVNVSLIGDDKNELSKKTQRGIGWDWR